MKDFKTIPIPQLMLDNCEVDPRGLPVPFVVLKDTNGKHHFKINDEEKSHRCREERLCTICGTKMIVEDRWLVGGIASAWDEKGYYIDLPVHKKCGEYALKVCPYLAYSNYNGKLDMDKLQAQLPTTLLHNPTVDPDRLPLFVLLRPQSFGYFMRSDGVVLKAFPPYLEVEYWNDGTRITDMEVVVEKLTGTKWEKYLNKIVKYEHDKV